MVGSDVTQADHSRAKELFLDALDLPPGERGAFLTSVCGDQPDLRARVEALLASHDMADEIGIAARDLGAGDPLGDYKLLEALGEGGFGRVFRAEQLRPVRRQVAVKLLKPGANSKQVVARFEAETRVLARMEHPHIARVLDAGTSPQGQPFFVMELVDGEPITTYCARRQLDLTTRLDLFRQVCVAIHHAHSKGVLHRDIKPNNVLVTEVDGLPQPRIIDFGVAKSLEGDVAGTQLTVEGLFIGTPSYMSPEQMDASADVDTRSDVYALGVLLYELVSGRLPFDPDGTGVAALMELQRMIRETLPARPSEVDGSERTVPEAVPREVDWVCMRAIESDPERRYPTAFALAADVARLLADMPVDAAPASTTYRLRKFVARHRAASLFAGAALLAVALGMTGTLIEWRRAERLNRALADALAAADEETKEARAQFEIAEAVNAFLTRDLLRAVTPSIRPGHGHDVSMSEVLEAAAERIDDAAAEGGRFADKPRVEGRVRHAIGQTYAALGRDGDALPQLERALELLRGSIGKTHAETLRCLVDLAAVHYGLGRNEEAEAVASAALPDLNRVLGPSAEQTLAAVKIRAAAMRGLGREAEAEEVAETGLTAARDSGGGRTLGAAGLLLGRAIQEADAGRMEEAEKLFLEGIDIRTEKQGREAPNTLIARSNYTVLLMRSGREEEALEHLDDLLPAMRRVLGDTHPDTMATLRNAATLYMQYGRKEEGAEAARAAYEVTLAQFGPDHADTLWTMDVYAFAEEAQGNVDEACRIMEELVERSEREYGLESPITVNRIGNLGVMLVTNERFAAAEPVLFRALELNEKLHGERDPFTLQLLEHLAAVYRSRDEDGEAEWMLREALERGRDRPPAAPQMLLLRWELVQLLRDAERWDEALELLETSHAELSRIHGPEDARTLGGEALILDTLVRAGRFGEARELEERLAPFLDGPDAPEDAADVRRPPPAD